MKNLSQLMQQAQAMQTKMAEVQERLAAAEVSGVAGGGMVTVTLTGKGEMKRIKIDPTMLKPEDAEILEDLIVAAHAEAKAKQEAEMAEQMRSVTGGLPLPPGLKLF